MLSDGVGSCEAPKSKRIIRRDFYCDFQGAVRLFEAGNVGTWARSLETANTSLANHLLVAPLDLGGSRRRHSSLAGHCCSFSVVAGGSRSAHSSLIA